MKQGTVYAVIPFRKGSLRLPNKNMLTLCGIPLVRHTIQQTLLAMDDIIVTTDYDLDYIKTNIPEIKNSGISVHKRIMVDEWQPATEYLSQIINTYDLGPEDSIVLLQPTCPCRMPGDIRKAIRKYQARNGETLVSVFRLESIRKLYTSINGIDAESFSGDTVIDINDISNLYVRNSSIYIFKVGYFRSTRMIFSNNPIIYEMPWFRSVDINTAEDFEMARALLEGGLVHWSPQL